MGGCCYGILEAKGAHCTSVGTDTYENVGTMWERYMIGTGNIHGQEHLDIRLDYTQMKGLLFSDVS